MSGRVQARKKGARDQHLTTLSAVGGGVDEEVGDRCRRSADIARVREQPSDAPDQRIRSVRIQILLVLVDRGVVGLVVNQQHRHVGNPAIALGVQLLQPLVKRSEEHTSELQSLMRISYAVFCLKKKKIQNITQTRQLNH